MYFLTFGIFYLYFFYIVIVQNYLITINKYSKISNYSIYSVVLFSFYCINCFRLLTCCIGKATGTRRPDDQTSPPVRSRSVYLWRFNASTCYFKVHSLTLQTDRTLTSGGKVPQNFIDDGLQNEIRKSK